MSEFYKVYPVDGATVINPQGKKPIPEDGRRVRASAYWERMKVQGLVEIEKLEKTEGKNDAI